MKGGRHSSWCLDGEKEREERLLYGDLGVCYIDKSRNKDFERGGKIDEDGRRITGLLKLCQCPP